VRSLRSNRPDSTKQVSVEPEAHDSFLQVVREIVGSTIGFAAIGEIES